MKYKNLKIRTKKGVKYGYCKLKDKEVSMFCSKCPFEVKYDVEKIKQQQKNNKTNKPIKQRSNRLTKTEKNRFSIIYQDLTKCCVDGCSTPYYGAQKNEVFDGSYRQLSIKYGMVCTFCKNHHDLFHKNREFALYYKRLFQDRFVEENNLETFLKIFKMDYYYRK